MIFLVLLSSCQEDMNHFNIKSLVSRVDHFYLICNDRGGSKYVWEWDTQLPSPKSSLSNGNSLQGLSTWGFLFSPLKTKYFITLLLSELKQTMLVVLFMTFRNILFQNAHCTVYLWISEHLGTTRLRKIHILIHVAIC